MGGRESTADARSAAGSKEAEIRTWLLTADGGEVEVKGRKGKCGGRAEGGNCVEQGIGEDAKVV